MKIYFIIAIMLISNVCKAQWPSIDAYRTSSAIKILEDMETLNEQGNVYLVMPYIADIGAMVKRTVIPFPQFSYNSNGKKKTLKEFVPDLVKTFNGLEDSRKVSAITSISLFADVDSYIPVIKEIVSKSEGSYNYKEILDEQATIMAASGNYELALSQMAAYGNSFSGERAYMHLAVTKAFQGFFQEAEKNAQESISRIKNNEPDFETIREFFHLMHLFGQKHKNDIAMRLIELFPEESNQISAKAYFYSGSKNLTMLKSLISSALKTKHPNYPLTEIGALGAKLKSSDIANASISAMNLRYDRQNPVYIMTELAIATKSRYALDRAKSYAAAIPSTATYAKSDAKIWISIASLKLAESENEAKNILIRIQELSPEYRVKFHLRWNGYMSQRYYTGYH